MPEAGRVREGLTREVEDLELEVVTLSRMFEESPRFFGHPRNFPNAHYGYLMTCMGKIDVLSSYWSGQVGSQGQTRRMISFMDHCLHPGRIEEQIVAVQMVDAP
jgi:hypothetical protein